MNDDDQAAQIERDLAAVVDYLRQFPSVRRVWLFGSAAKGRRLDFRSDIDIAVEGLPPDKHYLSVSMLMSLTKFPVDLVVWEEADEVLRGEIERWGRIIYEAES